LADPKKPVNPFAPKSGKKATTGVPKSVNPFAPKSTKKVTKTSTSATDTTDTGGKPGADPLAPIASFGQTVLGYALSPLAFIQGYTNQAIKESEAVATGKKKLNYLDLIGSDIAAGVKNAQNSISGKTTVVGKDIIASAGLPATVVDVPLLGPTDLGGLALDIAMDPTNLIPGKVLTTPLKAAAVAGKTTLKAGKIAATEGKVSVKLNELAPKITEVNGAEVAAVPESLKPGALFVNQYTKKPLVKYQNIRSEGPMATRLAKTEKTVADRFLYKTLEIAGKATPLQVIASAIEAGGKAAATTILGDIANSSLSTIAKNEARAAKALKGAVPQIIEEGIGKDMVPYQPHVSPDGVTVLDGNNGIHQFADEAEATAWVKAQKDAPAVIKTTKGLKPVVDTAPFEATGDLVSKLNPTTFDGKAAKSMLTAIDKIAKGAVGASATQVAAGGQKLSLRKNVKDVLANSISGEVSPFEILRNLLTRGDKSQEVAVATHLTLQTVTGATGKTATIAELMNKTAFAKMSKTAQEQVIKHFQDFLADPTIGREMVEGAAATERKYTGFSDLVAGLKAGDSVDYAVLEKLLKRIDPEHKVLAEVEKAAGSATAYDQIKNVLVSQGAQTVYDTQRRMNLSDAATLFKTDGLALSDTMSAYSDGRMNGTIPPLDAAVVSSRQAAHTRVSKWMDNPDTAGVMRDVLRAVNSGLGKNFEYIEKEIMGSPELMTGVSSFGDLAARSTKRPFMAETKAALLRQINQSGEAKMLGNLFGIARKRSKTSTIDIDEMIMRTTMLEDAILSILGARTVYAKPVAAGGSKHYVYITNGDFMKVMRDANPEALKAALFPDVSRPGITKYDSLSTVGIGKAIRRVMEAKETNSIVDMQEVLRDLLSRGEGQAPWSATYASRAPQIANDVAIAIRDNVDSFMKFHTERASAVVEDTLSSAQTLSEDLYTSLLEGWKANLNTGLDSTAARAQLVRDWFNKFVYASRLFEQQSGREAQNIFQAAAMVFVRDGKLTDLTQGMDVMPKLIGSPNAKDAASKQIFRDVTEAINGFFKMQNSDAIAKPGRERLPFPSAASIENATTKLTEAKLAYEEHMTLRSSLQSAAEVKAWESRFTKLQSYLDKAREVAWKNSVPTQHFQDGKWVPSEFYRRDAALADAMAKGKNALETPEGLVGSTEGLADSATAYPSHKALTAAESEKWLADWRKKNNVRSIDANSALREELARETLDNLDEYGQLELTPGELAQRLLQDQTAKVYDDAQVKVFISNTEYDGSSWFKQTAEKLNATSGRSDLKPLLNQAESTIMTSISRVADATHYLRASYIKKWGKLTVEERSLNVLTAFKHAVDRTPVPDNFDPTVAALANDLRSILDPFFGNPETSMLIKYGIDPKALGAAFYRYGLGEKIGFLVPGTEGLKNPNKLAEYTKWLPFAEMPEEFVGTDFAKTWERRAETFKNSGEDPFIILMNMVHAAQFAISEKTFVTDFASQFGYKAQGMTFDQAIANGWVKIQGKGASADLSLHLPTPEEGGLFPPEIAEQFMSLNREWNKLYNSKQMGTVLNTMMNIQGFLKATQTILTPRHHITNAFGDTTTAMIAGVLNPVHWGQAWEMAMRFAKDDVRTTWGKNKLPYKMTSMFNGFENFGKTVEVTDKAGRKSPGIILIKNGKAVKQGLNIDDLYREFQNRGIVIGNIFQNDIQGAYESVAATGKELGNKRKLYDVVAANAAQGINKITEPAGALASYYGNIPRVAHAMKVIQSRSWKSVEEALNAASAEITRYHPTIQSLAASERKGPRLLFTYYTWLRVAHNAMIDMALNHTGAMLVPSKIQYAQAEGGGLAPQSISNPWTLNELAPSYLTGSVYAPTSVAQSGSKMLYKRSFLPLDLLDTYNFQVDPNKTWDQNALSNAAVLGRFLGKNTSIVLQPALEWISGTDMQTGQKSSVTDLQTLGDKVISNFGFKSLLQGIGAYTPAKNEVGTSKELTEEELKVARENFWFGQKGVIVNSPKYIKSAQTEQRERINTFIKNYIPK